MKTLFPAVIVAASLVLSGCTEGIVEYNSAREAKKAVSEGMRDPRSAEFRNIRHSDHQGNRVVCGEVNGRNAFGAMAGFEQFMYLSPLVRVGYDSESSFAIYQCCRHLRGGPPLDARNTADVEECANVDPAMPLIW